MKLVYRTHPWPHQAKALKRMIRQRGGGINVPMRWGKSWVGINWAAALYHLEDVRRVLVVTVTSGLDVWEDQISQHCPVPYNILTHHGECVEIYDAGPHLRFMIVNYQNLYSRAHTGVGRQWLVVDNPTLAKFNPQAVIVDESHHIGDPTAEQSKHLYRLSRSSPFRLFMTGTMFHRKPFFVFGQVKFYDDGKTFGTAWGHFKKRIGIFGGYMNYEVKGYRNLDWMMKEVRKFTHIEKYVPSRPPVTNLIKFPLQGGHLKAYQDMEQHRILRVAGEDITADMVLTYHLRLLQVAGGFMKTSKGYKQVGDSKLKILEDRLSEYLNQDIYKAVIGCRFIPELAGIAKVAKRVGFKVVLFHGGVPPGRERTRRKQSFASSKDPILFVSQISTGKESIDLSAASVMMFYSLTESYVEFDQFCRRIEKYDEKRTLMYDFLLGHGTQDIVAYEAMKLKMDVTDFLMTDPARAEQLVAAKRGKRR